MTDKNYQGQWIGTSDSGSYCVANINDNGLKIDGRISMFESAPLADNTIPFWALSYLLGDKNDEGKVAGKVHPPVIYRSDGDMLTIQERTEFETKTSITFPNETDFLANKIGLYQLEVNWSSKYLSGETRKDRVVLEKKRLGGSSIFHQHMTWDQFKSFATNDREGQIYRGQARHWRLQTAFHRTGHADLSSYLDEKIPELENHINAFAKHEYNMKDDRALGSLLNLAQHHGYPTPLLDWTKSPFVAAFFAFTNKSIIKKGGTVSIFLFNDSKWSAMAGRIGQLRSPKLSVKAMELPGYGNARVLPQQSITMFSNVDDIELLIKQNENTPGEYLTAVSISADDREKAMKDLHLMGISWGSIFPGVEGVCKQLSERHFGS
jgi:hypothetical protein